MLTPRHAVRWGIRQQIEHGGIQRLFKDKYFKCIWFCTSDFCFFPLKFWEGIVLIHTTKYFLKYYIFISKFYKCLEPFHISITRYWKIENWYFYKVNFLKRRFVLLQNNFLFHYIPLASKGVHDSHSVKI